MSLEVCQVNVVHKDLIAKAQQGIPVRNKVAGLAQLYKLLGDPGRLKIMLALNTCEMCVCDLAVLVESTPSAISHQLRLLRTARLVETRKDGKMVYYRVEDNSVQRFLLAGLSYQEEVSV